ncbi:MAG: hypothetical protein HZA89_07535 [Verrucomicrobia bacterium]|nr:hypothetical protein [Verrucomicrobiota bacterium]
MEKSFKRKMLTVAAIHLLTSFVVWFQVSFIYRDPISDNFALALQPQFWLLKKSGGFGMLWELPDWLFVLLCCMSITLWSLCFGWLYAKAVDRLNRFPILGHKLF